MGAVAIDPKLAAKAEAFFARSKWPWGYFRVGDALVYVPMKCGSTSFRFALMPTLALTPARPGRSRTQAFFDYARDNELGPFPFDVDLRGRRVRRVLAVRHPVERFASLWRDINAGRSPAFAALAGVTPDELAAIVEAYTWRDPHFEPQSGWYVAGTELFEFSRLLELLGLPREHRRRTPRYASDPPMPSDRILALYQKDLELWQRACATSASSGPARETTDPPT